VATTKKIILQGGGEHARVVLDCLLASSQLVVGIFDPKYAGELMGVPQLGAYNPKFQDDAQAIVAIGDNSLRKRVAHATQHAFANAIHTSCIISSTVTMGVGNMILHGSILQAQTVVGNHAIINTGAQVDHDCVIGDFAHIAPGCILCGTIEIGEGAFVGAGTVILPGIKIGAWATVGAGSVVVKDIPAHALAFGNPATVRSYKHV
jgi:sugar O-acyltransferase (sialic acid O-acetyltransferase NeuD family)